MLNEKLACQDLMKKQGDEGFCYFDKVRANLMVARGLAEVNPAMEQGDSVATRITDKGRELAVAQPPSLFGAEPEVANMITPNQFGAAPEEQPSLFGEQPVEAPLTEPDYLLKHLPGTYKAIAKAIGVAPEAAKKALDELVAAGRIVKEAKTYKALAETGVVELEEAAEELGVAPAYFPDEKVEVLAQPNDVFAKAIDQEFKESGVESEIEFDKDIPIPAGVGRNRASKLPNLSAMEIGDSFWFSVEGSTAKNPAGSISSQISNRAKKEKLGYKFTVRKVGVEDPRGSGVRVWRKA